MAPDAFEDRSTATNPIRIAEPRDRDEPGPEPRRSEPGEPDARDGDA